MGVSFSAEAGFGVRVDISDRNLLDDRYKEFREYIWDKSSKRTKEYYGSIEEMFSPDNFEMETISDKLPNLRFSICTNPYTEKPKISQWFAVARTTYVEIEDEPGYQDLSAKSFVSPEAKKELDLLRSNFATDNENPRWYMWFNYS
jgi:hypothetical protein